MPRLLTRFTSILRDPRVREVVRWCLPALLVGLILRAALTAQLPYAFFHDDAPDFLVTPDRLMNHGKFDLHSKKTFLVPIAFTVPFILHIPAMLAIPVGQHVLGLGSVLLVGLLCRLWFARWKVFIIPLTLVAAVNPFLLWYEHALLAESLFVFCTLLVAAAGTLYARAQTLPRFVLLCVALFLVAGARPEGKLLFGFGLLMLAWVHWGEWRLHRVRLAVFLALAVLTHFKTKTSQAGLLLYTSLARFTPSELKCAPGFDPFIGTIRADLLERWSEKPSFPKVRDRRAIADAVARYLKERPEFAGSDSHSSVNSFCLKLAMETLRRNFFAMPAHAFSKFRIVANESPSGRLDNDWLFEKQREAYLGEMEDISRLSVGLFGQKIATPAEMNAFLDTHYGEVRWFNALSDAWLRAVNAWRFPDAAFPDRDSPTVPFIYRGVPFYFLLGTLGLLAVMLRSGALRPFHIAWGLTLLAFFYTIMLTGNVRPRFRFVFEPFWFLYLALLADSLWLGATRALHPAGTAELKR